MSHTIIELINCNIIGFRSLRLCRSLDITVPLSRLTRVSKPSSSTGVYMPTRSGRNFTMLPLTDSPNMSQNNETPRASSAFDSPQTMPLPTSPDQEDDLPTMFSKLTRITHQLASVFKRQNSVDSNTAEEAFGTANAPNYVTTTLAPENPETNQPPRPSTMASNLLPILNKVPVPNVHVPIVPLPYEAQTAAIAILSKQQEWPKFTGTPEDFKGWKNTFISAISTSELKCLYDESSFELVETCDSQNDRILYSKIVSSLPANDFFRSEDEYRGHGLALWKALIRKYEPKDTLLIVHKLQSHFLGDLARDKDEDLDKYYRRFHDIANRINRVIPNSISATSIRTRFLLTLGPDYEFFKEQITLGILDQKWYTSDGTKLKDDLREIQANRAALQGTPSTLSSGTTIGSYTGQNYQANAMKSVQTGYGIEDRLNALGEQVAILVQAATANGSARGNPNGRATGNSNGTGNSNSNGNSNGTGNSISAEHSDGTNPNRPLYSKYCHSCGENLTHSSRYCGTRKPNHVEDATWKDRKGGSTVTLPRE
jgi:hypothetical protein